MKELYEDIHQSVTWDSVEVIEKGWSEDIKFHIRSKEGSELLLRVSDISKYESKKKEFECMQQVAGMNFLMSRPIEFGVCNKGQSVYSLLTWLEGEAAETALPKLSKLEQYELGVCAGEYLQQIHQIPAPKSQPDWSDYFNRKMDRKIENYNTCVIHFREADQMVDFIDSNRSLLINRPQTFQHGDYHVGNMIISQSGHLGIIDFNRFDYGDPWEEFNRITWCVGVSPEFASGYINGYFSNDVPELFFKLMAVYIAANQISSIPWAIPFGEEEVKVMVEQTKAVWHWYDGFEKWFPKWHILTPRALI